MNIFVLGLFVYYENFGVKKFCKCKIVTLKRTFSKQYGKRIKIRLFKTTEVLAPFAADSSYCGSSDSDIPESLSKNHQRKTCHTK